MLAELSECGKLVTSYTLLNQIIAVYLLQR